jgi:hypothetical protein
MRFVVREIEIDNDGDEESNQLAQAIFDQELLVDVPESLVEGVENGTAALLPDVMDYVLNQASEITGWCIVSCTIEEHTNDDGNIAE